MKTVRELRTFFTVVLEPNIHTFSVLSETLCGNFTLLGSYVTVAFAASMAILWVIVVLHEVLVQFTAVVVAFVFRGILAYGFGHLAGFLRILPMVVLHCGENLFSVIFAKIHQL